jgi:excisionase family DNA binding protein
MNKYEEQHNFDGRKLLTGPEVASILNCSLAFAYRLMRQGAIPTIRLGRAVRVRFEDLDSFITSSQSKEW